MARLRPVKTNFTNGEIDPLITMRSDLELFVNGASKMRNAQPFAQGGFRRRDGMEFMTQIPPGVQLKPIGVVELNRQPVAQGINYAVGDILTIPGGTGTAATIKVTKITGGTDAVADFYLINSGDYTVAPTSPAVTTGGSGTGFAVAFSIETQDTVQIIDFTFSVDQNYLIVFTVSRFYIFRKEDTGSGPNQLVEQGAHPYSNQQLLEITWTQSLDVMVIFHENFPFFNLIRTSETVWTFTEAAVLNKPSFAFGVKQTATLTVPIGATPKIGDVINISVSAVSPNFAVLGNFIRVFGGINLDGEDVSSYYKIVGNIAAVSVNAEILTLPLVSTASFTVNGGSWLAEEPEWGRAVDVLGDRGFPRCGTFFQGRLCTGGSTARPNTFWTSRAGDIADFNNGGVADDLGIVITADSGDISTFQNMYPGRHLQIYADSSEFYIPVSELEPMTPNTSALRRTTSVGSISGVPIFEVDGVVYFIQRGGESMRQFVFVDGEKAYAADIVSLFSSHLIRNPTDAAFKKSRNTEDGNYIWLVNSQDRSLAAFSILRSEQINAWALYTSKGDFHHSAVLDQTSYFHMKRFPGGRTSYSGNFFEIVGLGGPETVPTGVSFNDDGTKVFTVGRLRDRIFEFNLLTPYSFDRLSVEFTEEFSVISETTNPKDIIFSPDGLKLFILDRTNDLVLEYDMTNPYSVAPGNIVFSGDSYDYGAQETSGGGVDFSADGLKMFIVGTANDTVFEYDLINPFSMAGGNVSYSGNSFSVLSETVAPEDVKFSADGKRFYIVGSDNGLILQYILINPFSLAGGNVSYSGNFLDVNNEDDSPHGMSLSNDGLTIAIIGNDNDLCHEYNLEEAFKIGTEIDTIEFFNEDLRTDSGVIATGLTDDESSVGDLDWLKDSSVYLIIDGILRGEFTVGFDGILTFPSAALSSYQFGLSFPDIEGEEEGTNVLVETLPSDILLSEGTTMGKKKRVVSSTVRFVDTQGFYLQNIQVPFRNLPCVLDVPIEEQTGQKELRGLLGWNEFGQIKITQKEPLSMTILGLAYDLSTV